MAFVRRKLGPLLVLAGIALAAVLSQTRATSAGKAAKHLNFRRSYAEALLEARVRNVPLFVSRHKDE